MDELCEILPFLTVDSRLHLKSIGLQLILGLTGSEEGKQLLISRPVFLNGVLDLLHDPSTRIAEDACLCIINLSAEETGVRVLVSEECCRKNEKSDENTIASRNVVNSALSHVIDPESSLADRACEILSNITRPLGTMERVLDLLLHSTTSFETLVHVFTKIGFNKKGATLHCLGHVFTNLSQSSLFRRYLMEECHCTIQRLLPFTEYKESIIRRGAIVGTLRNCCFEIAHHLWLLGPDVDILPRLLLPLAGPEEFDEDDTEKLPIELQYLPPDKAREPDPEIRRMILETLLQLCTTREAREFMRKCNTYVILRELHKWEKDRKVLLACENVVDILIRNEDEIGRDNIQEIEVPEDLQDKFQKIDNDFMEG